MKKYQHKLIIFDRLIKEKQAIKGRENVSREILMQEVLDDIGAEGYTLTNLNGDTIATREAE